MESMREQFLAGATVALEAISDDSVVAAWGQPSALADHTVGSLAAHLAFACEVQEFLDHGVPDGPPTFETAAQYYAEAIELLTDEVNQGIHDRSDADAAEGPAAVAALLSERLATLPNVLASEPKDRLVYVFGGTMSLDAFLWTRVVEQVVHLDDLWRSLGDTGGSPSRWENPPDAEALVISLGAEVGRQRRGGPAMLRALFRDSGTEPSPLPVI